MYDILNVFDVFNFSLNLIKTGILANFKRSQENGLTFAMSDK